MLKKSSGNNIKNYRNGRRLFPPVPKKKSLKMKKIANFTLLLLFAALLPRCKDNDPIIPPPPPPPCLAGLDSVTIPAVNQDTINDFSWCVFSWIPFYPERYKYSFPSFNPNNAAEIAFVRWDRQENEWHLCILDFCSGELRIITDQAFEYVDWGKKDWIIFIGRDHQVWKVQSNGEGLTRLTNGGENSNCIWNADGNAIVYVRTNAPGYCFMLNENGTILDTIEKMQARPAFDWSPDDKILTLDGDANTYGFGYYDMALDTIVFVEEVELKNYIHQMEWSKDYTEIFWTGVWKIARTNIHTSLKMEIINLPDGVNNRRYIGFTISPDFKHIVTCREDWKQLNECDVEIRTNLYIMNIDGMDERKILIPE